MNLIDVIQQIQQRLTLSIGLISPKKTLLIFTIALIATGCWEKNYDYAYDICIHNKTSDTLIFKIGLVHLNSGEFYRVITLYPNDTMNGNESALGGFSANEGVNPVHSCFSSSWKMLDTVLVFHKDTLKCIWTAPAYGGPDSNHDFFNYNSWSYWIEKNPYGVMMFTIYPEDLKLNNE